MNKDNIIDDCRLIGRHVALRSDSYECVSNVIKKYNPDLMITDPPYHGMEYTGGGVMKNIDTFQEFNDKNLTSFDVIAFMSLAFEGFIENGKPFNAYVFCNRFMMKDLLLWADSQKRLTWDVLIFTKTPLPFNGGHYLIDKEYCVYIREPKAFFNQSLSFDKFKTVREMIRFSKENKPTTTPKHPSILIPLIKVSADTGHVILDPFAGSFNTGIAAELCDTSSILIEKDTDEFDVGCNRLMTYINCKQVDLFKTKGDCDEYE